MVQTYRAQTLRNIGSFYFQYKYIEKCNSKGQHHFIELFDVLFHKAWFLYEQFLNKLTRIIRGIIIETFKALKDKELIYLY